MANTDICLMELKGTVKDAHENFPIRFDVSDNGNSFLIGARMHMTKKVGNNEVEQRMDIRAFGEVAESLAHIQDGDHIHVKGDYGLQKSNKDGKWYPIVTVTEVVEA
jgi:hypothetical protein